MIAQLKETPQELSCILRVDATLQRQIAVGVSSREIAEAIVVDSPEMAQLASDERTNMARAIDQMKELRKGFLAPAQQIIDNAKALFNPALEALEESRSLIGSKLLAWQQAEEARKAELKRKADELARIVRQEAEAKAAAERASAEEVAAAARRDAEEAERRRQEAAAAGDTHAAAGAAIQAAMAQKRADAVIESATAKAEAIEIEATASIQTPGIAPSKIAGSTLKDNWIAALNDEIPGITEDKAKALIVAACAAGRTDLLAVLAVDQSALNKLAKALKGAMNVPGYKAFNDRKLAGKRK